MHGPCKAGGSGTDTLESYLPENSLYIIASYPLEKRYKKEKDNIDLIRYTLREYRYI